MIKRPFATLLPRLLLAAVATHIAACNDRDRSVASLDIAEPEAMTEEQQWLSKLQMVRVQLDGEDEITEMEVNDFKALIEVACSDAIDFDTDDACSDALGLGLFYLCEGKTLLAAANTQSTPLSITFQSEEYADMLVPEQSEETNAALAEQAVTHARFAMEFVLFTLGIYDQDAAPAPSEDCNGVS